MHCNTRNHAFYVNQMCNVRNDFSTSSSSYKKTKKNLSALKKINNKHWIIYTPFQFQLKKNEKQDLNNLEGTLSHFLSLYHQSLKKNCPREPPYDVWSRAQRHRNDPHCRSERKPKNKCQNVLYKERNRNTSHNTQE